MGTEAHRVGKSNRLDVDWPFHRHHGNPILTADDLPYAANTVFNAAATVVAGGETLLLLRVEDRRGLSHLTVARSRDGVGEWRIDAAPSFPADPEGHTEELWGVEDPRITWVEDQQLYYIAYTAYSAAGPLVSLASTADFVTFTRLGPVMPPDDKDAALFPVRFDGRYAMLHRPSPTSTGGAHIWLSYSTDMMHWGDHQILLRARKGGWWDANKIGLSTPPLLTDEGWLHPVPRCPPHDRGGHLPPRPGSAGQGRPAAGAPSRRLMDLRPAGDLRAAGGRGRRGLPVRLGDRRRRAAHVLRSGRHQHGPGDREGLGPARLAARPLVPPGVRIRRPPEIPSGL